jgi:hypothetical protein
MSRLLASMVIALLLTLPLIWNVACAAKAEHRVHHTLAGP